MAQILQALDREWSELATSPRALRALIRWSNTHPALAGNTDLIEVLFARRDPNRSGPILKALALLAPTDDPAARTLLQALGSGLVSLVTRSANDDEAAPRRDDLAGLGADSDLSAPAQRLGGRHILLDARKRCRHPRQRNAGLQGSRWRPVDEHAPPEDRTCDRLFLEELAAAQRTGMRTGSIRTTIRRTPPGRTHHRQGGEALT